MLYNGWGRLRSDVVVLSSVDFFLVLLLIVLDDVLLLTSSILGLLVNLFHIVAWCEHLVTTHHARILSPLHPLLLSFATFLASALV